MYEYVTMIVNDTDHVGKNKLIEWTAFITSVLIMGQNYWLLVFKATFNTISVISWESMLLMGVTQVPRENHLHSVIQWQTFSYEFVLSTLMHGRESNLIGDGH